MMGVNTYREYQWTNQPEWFEDYCVALVGAITPEEALAGLHAGAERLEAVGMKQAFRDGYELGERHGVDGVDRQLIAVTDIGEGWTLLVQKPGFIGISDEPMGRLAATHEVVSHSEDVNAFGQFVWWSEGEQKASFEPMLPYTNLLGVLSDRQDASSRERLVTLIGEVGGIDLSFEPDRTAGYNHVPGAFALAERLTGVRITQEELSRRRFTVAVVPLNPADTV